jgi:phosphoglycolate/pyridoxal phosphate phosphatase family enzyme
MNAASVLIKAVIFDLDGVIYRGRTPFPGASATLDALRSQHCPAYFFTNNSTRSRESYVALLAGFGIASDPDHIVTSASLTVDYLRAQYAGRAPTIHVVGEEGLREELRRAGFRVVARLPKRGVEVVVVGMDRRFTYAKLHVAQQALLGGAEFIATNRDATYPVEGNVIPGGGSIVAAVAAAAEREPITMGKPSEWSGRLIARHAGIAPSEMLMVGDRIETDIVMGRRAGLWTVMVLTGISTLEEALATPEPHQPQWVIPSIAEVPDLIAALAAGGRVPFDWVSQGVQP